MVIPLGGVAATAAHAANAGATALGLGMGKTDLDLTRDLFKMQMQQAKRLWTADWAEASVRHAESCMQATQQHVESQAMAMATYYQAEKIAGQGIKLARDQDSRAYEMAWRSEVREGLRDELTNQNNRFNIVMLCDTVCLGFAFSFVADGSPPVETSIVMLYTYMFFLGLSTMLFSVSLWCCIIVVRRLHEHTAGKLERKLFAQSEDLQNAWRHQLAQNPTQPSTQREMKLVDQAYEKWVECYLDPLGIASINMLSYGVVAVFITAGLFVHNQYAIDYNAPIAALIFWSMAIITSATVLFMKYSEDRHEKKKEGVYDNSWQDNNANEGDTGPFAKITKAAETLMSTTAVAMASTERMEDFHTREKKERGFCAETESTKQRLESLEKEARTREKMRKEILQLLTTADEEFDALPEELTSHLNKMIHNVDEADHRTATLVSQKDDELVLKQRASHQDWSRMLEIRTLPSRPPMAQYPIDAQRTPLSLGSLRKKLGEVALTTMLRVKNMSDEPLRLKSGVQLKDGRYIKSLNASDPHNEVLCYHLYPGPEIPPRSEVVVVARSGGTKWVRTSGIEGQLAYTNRDETWVFKISFCNSFVGHVRKCRIEASHVAGSNEDEDDDDTEVEDETARDEYWKMTKDEIDHKANNEYVISIDVLRGNDATLAAFHHRRSQVTLKAGHLQKNKAFGLGLQWYQKWLVLTPAELLCYQDIGSMKYSKIDLRNITRVQPGSDNFKKNVFEIHTDIAGVGPYRFSADSPADQDDWIQKIAGAAKTELERVTTSLGSGESSLNDGIECIQSDMGIETLPV